MQYTVKMTAYTIGQVQEIISYISHTLRAPQAAAGWADCLQEQLQSLATFPARFPLVNREPWKSKGVRKTSVKNFIIYYTVEQASNTVWIIAVIYGRRDQISQLQNAPI